jgi:hypothetical protein
MIKSRAQLKKAFADGTMPAGTDFANLIDSMVQEDEYQQFVSATNAALAQQPDCQLGDFPQVPQWIALGGEIGRYDPSSQDASAMQPASALTTLSVPADGKWHAIVPALAGCFAFRVLASASDGKDAHALTHALVTTAFSGKRCQIDQTQAYSGLRFWRRISFCWKKGKQGYDLCVRTRCDYGSGSDGKPVAIQYHLCRLW